MPYWGGWTFGETVQAQVPSHCMHSFLLHRDSEWPRISQEEGRREEQGKLLSSHLISLRGSPRKWGPGHLCYQIPKDLTEFPPFTPPDLPWDTHRDWMFSLPLRYPLLSLPTTIGIFSSAGVETLSFNRQFYFQILCLIPGLGLWNSKPNNRCLYNLHYVSTPS